MAIGINWSIFTTFFTKIALYAHYISIGSHWYFLGKHTHIYIYLMGISGLIIEGYCYSFIDHWYSLNHWKYQYWHIQMVHWGMLLIFIEPTFLPLIYSPYIRSTPSKSSRSRRHPGGPQWPLPVAPGGAFVGPLRAEAPALEVSAMAVPSWVDESGWIL